MLCCMLQVYGPKGLGKLSTGGHPRHLAQAQQGRLENQPQNGVNDVPHMQQHQDTEPVDGSIDNHEELHSPDQVKQGTISQDQLSQVQRSQEQHSQQQVKEQFSDGGAKGKAVEGQAQAVPIRKADCFATFNPPTVQEYQEVMLAAKLKLRCIWAHTPEALLMRLPQHIVQVSSALFSLHASMPKFVESNAHDVVRTSFAMTNNWLCKLS